MLCRQYAWGARARLPFYVNLDDDEPSVGGVLAALGASPGTQLRFETLYGWYKRLGCFDVNVSIVAAIPQRSRDAAVDRGQGAGMVMCMVTCEDDWEYGRFYVDTACLVSSDVLDKVVALWLASLRCGDQDPLFACCFRAFHRDRLLLVAQEGVLRTMEARMRKCEGIVNQPSAAASSR